MIGCTALRAGHRAQLDWKTCTDWRAARRRRRS